MDDKIAREIYAKISAPFPEEAIQRTKGSETRRGYDTTGIAYQFVVNRLNEAVGLYGWNYEYQILKEFEGSYNSGQQFWDITLEVSVWVGDSSVVRKAPGGHKATSYADALKGALTNGLKKAVAMFGVGRQAYEGTLDDDNVPHPQEEGGKLREMPKSIGMVSQKQIGLLIQVCREHGVTAEQTKAYLQTFGIDSRKGIPQDKFEQTLAWVRAQKPTAEEPGSQG